MTEKRTGKDKSILCYYFTYLFKIHCLVKKTLFRINNLLFKNIFKALTLAKSI